MAGSAWFPRALMLVSAITTIVSSPMTASASPAPPAPTTSHGIASGYVARSYFYTGRDDPDQSLTATFRPTARNAPWVVTIHGGSWSSGGQYKVQPAVEMFSKSGFQVFNVAYRLIARAGDEPAVPWLAQKRDVLNALTWIRSHAAKFGINRNRGAIWGFSAGGHLATIAGLSGDGGNGIRAVVSNSGVLAPSQLYRDVYGTHHDGTVTSEMRSLAAWEVVATGCPYGSRKGDCAQRWAQFDPASYVSPHDPAVMIFHGTADTIVPYQLSVAFRHKLAAARTRNSLVLVPRLGHSWRASIDGATRQAAMVKFVKAHTAVDARP